VTQDWILYVPKMTKGATVDLGQEFKAATILGPDVPVNVNGKSVKGILGQAGRQLQWDSLWHGMLRSSSGITDNKFGDLSKSFVMLSLFERIPPMKTDKQENNKRFELFRRGGRKLDLSHVMSAGAMVVIAEAPETPLPFPMEVDGTPPEGTGTTYYQAVIPLKREKAEAAATQPAE
jgi:hypothetical protein